MTDQLLAVDDVANGPAPGATQAGPLAFLARYREAARDGDVRVDEWARVERDDDKMFGGYWVDAQVFVPDAAVEPFDEPPPAPEPVVGATMQVALPIMTPVAVGVMTDVIMPGAQVEIVKIQRRGRLPIIVRQVGKKNAPLLRTYARALEALQ